MNIVICCIIKDELPYLREWIDWHLNIGFDHIYLFEDYKSCSHEEITKDYDNVSLLSLGSYNIEYTASAKKQRLLYIKFAEEHQQLRDIDWCLFIDVDEYFVMEDGYTLESFLSEYKDYSAVYLSWKMFNAGGHVFQKPTNVTHFEYYTCEYDPFILHDSAKIMIKSFVNIKNHQGFDSLHVAIGGVYTDYSSEVERNPMCYEKAWLNHYFCRSWEDWCYRMFERGNQHNDFRTFDDWFDANPDFAGKLKEMLESILYKKLVSTYIISRKYGLISGGNINTIDSIKQKLHRNEHTDKQNR